MGKCDGVLHDEHLNTDGKIETIFTLKNLINN